MGDSPYLLRVAAGPPHAASSTVVGPGRHGAAAGAGGCWFAVQPRDRWGNRLTRGQMQLVVQQLQLQAQEQAQAQAQARQQQQGRKQQQHGAGALAAAGGCGSGGAVMGIAPLQVRDPVMARPVPDHDSWHQVSSKHYALPAAFLACPAAARRWS